MVDTITHSITHSITQAGQSDRTDTFHPTMIHQWKKSLLEGAAGIFERGGKATASAEPGEDTVRDLHAKIGELAVANDFLSRKLKSWTGK